MCCYCVIICLFFFSSRRRHTRSTRDWSSDVCSSDLCAPAGGPQVRIAVRWLESEGDPDPALFAFDGQERLDRIGKRLLAGPDTLVWTNRSEERRVGKEWRSRWAPYTLK